MPYAILMLAINAALIVHAAKTGRFNPWAYVILLLPGIGAFAYFVVEMVPEFMGTYKGQKLRSDIGKKLSPDRNYLALKDQFAVAATIANREALAAECLATGRHDEALLHYRMLKASELGGEPKFWIGAAQALAGLEKPSAALAELDDLKRRWPDYQSQEGHLLYARLLELGGRHDEALEEYESLAGYYAGAEPRARRIDLLDRFGRHAQARQEAELMLSAMRRSPAHVQRAQRQWIEMAQAVMNRR